MFVPVDIVVRISRRKMQSSSNRFGTKEPGARRPSPSSSDNLMLMVVCGIFFVAGCSSIGKSTSSRSDSGANAIQPAVAAKPASPPVELALQSAQPRTFKYANLQYTVTKAVISTRVAEELPIDNSKPAVADVTLSVVNMAKTGVTIRDGQWQLKLADGSVYKQPYEDSLQPRDTQERKASFHVPESSQWTGAQITLDEQDKEPATIALDGPVAPPQYPIALNLKSDEKTTKDPTNTYAIQTANIDLDGFGQRAALGKRYLNMTVHITCKEGGGGFVPEFFRLLINNEPSVPENSSESNLNCPGFQDYVMAYVIPASAAAVELEVGKTDIQKTATIPIDLKQ